MAEEMPDIRLLPYKMRRVSDLVKYHHNSRLHSEDQVELLAHSIKTYGFTNPVIIDGENGIIAGHGRLEAAKKLGMREVPTLEASHLTPEQKRAYVILDNKSYEFASSWNEDVLASELGLLAEDGVDLAYLGFTEDDMKKLLGEDLGGEDGGAAGAGPGITDVPLDETFWISVSGPAAARVEAEALVREIGKLPGVDVHSNLGDPKGRGGRGQEA